jgi:hypothetical protein
MALVAQKTRESLGNTGVVLDDQDVGSLHQITPGGCEAGSSTSVRVPEGIRGSRRRLPP